MLILNVYLPCDLQTLEALEEYRQSLAMLEIIIAEQNVNNVIIGGGGDFSADPLKGRFWKLPREFCDSMSLHILQDFLPSDAFTYLCPTRNTTSWLDHFICSNKFKDNVMNVSVNYETALYDHFPVTVVLNIPIHLEHFKDNDKVICNYVN